MQTNKGTFPLGSTWRRNPIPACNCNSGKNCGVDNYKKISGYPEWYKAYAAESQPEPVGGSEPCDTGTQFPVPCPKCYGQAPFGNRQARNMWAIVDELQVPNITGNFVLRWRWDTEQVPQIWTHCAGPSHTYTAATATHPDALTQTGERRSRAVCLQTSLSFEVGQDVLMYNHVEQCCCVEVEWISQLCVLVGSEQLAPQSCCSFDVTKFTPSDT
jgi:hypothetical protein